MHATQQMVLMIMLLCMQNFIFNNHAYGAERTPGENPLARVVFCLDLMKDSYRPHLPDPDAFLDIVIPFIYDDKNADNSLINRVKEGLITSKLIHSMRDATNREKAFDCQAYAFDKIFKLRKSITIDIESKKITALSISKYYTPTEKPIMNDMVTYSSTTNPEVHVGVYLGQDRVESKWGQIAAIICHQPDIVPYKGTITYWTIKNKYHGNKKISTTEYLRPILEIDIAQNKYEATVAFANFLLKYYEMMRNLKVELDGWDVFATINSLFDKFDKSIQ